MTLSRPPFVESPRHIRELLRGATKPMDVLAPPTGKRARQREHGVGGLNRIDPVHLRGETPRDLAEAVPEFEHETGHIHKEPLKERIDLIRIGRAKAIGASDAWVGKLCAILWPKVLWLRPCLHHANSCPALNQ